MNIDVVMFVEIGHAGGIHERFKGYVDGLFNMAIGIFGYFSNVHDHQVGIEGNVHRQFIGFHIDDHINGQTGCQPGFEATGKMSFEFIEAYPGQSYNGFSFLLWLSNEQQGLIEW